LRKQRGETPSQRPVTVLKNELNIVEKDESEGKRFI
jgi:hypothetical protein